MTDLIYEERTAMNEIYNQGEIESRLIWWNLCTSLRIMRIATCTLVYLYINNISHRALQDELSSTPCFSVALELGLSLR
jgi:hypothetical protein